MPRKPRKDKTVALHIKFNAQLDAYVRAVAKKEGKSKTEVVENLIRESILHREK